MLPPVAVRRAAGLPLVGPRLLAGLHQRGLGFDVVSWAEFADLVVSERPEHLSVDVFETCLVRDLAGDMAVKNVIAHQAGQVSATGQVSAGSVCDVAAAAEFEMCGPVDGAVPALARIRQVVGPVTFVADTERSSSLLEELLRRFGLFEDGDRVVVSCEAGATKSDGALFDKLWPGDLTVAWHAGDDPWSDGVVAAVHGFRPFEIREGSLTRYESVMSGRPTTIGPALAAASRSARLRLEEERRSGDLDQRDYQLQLLGTQVAGPVMASFVLWIAEQCRDYNISHLSFLARDGELPMLVAEAMGGGHLGDLPTSYLHCNRLIVTLASASSVGVDQWLADGTATEDAFLEVNRHVVPFSSLLARIGLESDDVAAVLGRTHGLAGLMPDQPLPHGAVGEWHELLASPATAELVAVRSAERRELLIDHVRSQGIGQEPLALVDVGWRGRLAWLLSSVLRDYLQHEPLHLHFGGDKVIPGLVEGARIERFAFDGISESVPLLSPVSTVETITASGKARVVDYRRTSSGEVEVVYDRASTDDGFDHRAEVWRGALRMAAAIPSRKSLRERGLETVALDHETRTLLGVWWNTPSKVEAAALAPLDFEHDEAGTALRPVVAPYHLTDMLGGRQARQWTAGSIAVSSPLNRLGVRLVMAARQLRRRFGAGD